MPNQIQVLDPHVADLIAAGEVVEDVYKRQVEEIAAFVVGGVEIPMP